jgi:hypothetical protein
MNNPVFTYSKTSYEGYEMPLTAPIYKTDKFNTSWFQYIFCQFTARYFIKTDRNGLAASAISE